MADPNDRSTPRKPARRARAPRRHADLPPSTATAAVEVTWRTAPKVRTRYLASDPPPGSLGDPIADRLGGALAAIAGAQGSANDDGPVATSRSAGAHLDEARDAEAWAPPEALEGAGAETPDPGLEAAADEGASAWAEPGAEEVPAAADGAAEGASAWAEAGGEADPAAEAGDGDASAWAEAGAEHDAPAPEEPPLDAMLGAAPEDEPAPEATRGPPYDAYGADPVDAPPPSAFEAPAAPVFEAAPPSLVAEPPPVPPAEALVLPTEWTAPPPPPDAPSVAPDKPPTGAPPAESEPAPTKPEAARWRMYAAQTLIATAAAIGGVALGTIRGATLPEAAAPATTTAVLPARTAVPVSPCPNDLAPRLDVSSEPRPRPTLARRRRASEPAPPTDRDRSIADLREIALALRAQGGLLRVLPGAEGAAEPAPAEPATRPAVLRR
jgi:hypothetical protein